MTKDRQDLEKYWHSALLHPSDFLKWQEFRGKDVTLTISDVIPRQELKMRGGRSETRPVLRFKETEKKLVLCKTNTNSIAKVLGTEVRKWIDKKITLYPDPSVRFGKEEVGGIRVRTNTKGK